VGRLLLLLLLLSPLPGAGQDPASATQQGQSAQCGAHSCCHQLYRGEGPGGCGGACSRGSGRNTRRHMLALFVWSESSFRQTESRRVPKVGWCLEGRGLPSLQLSLNWQWLEFLGMAGLEAKLSCLHLNRFITRG
jgi:hypothetical protein